MEWANFIVNSIILVLGALGGAFGAWIVSLYKTYKDEGLASNEQAIQIYRELCEKHSRKVDSLEQLYEILEKNYFELKEDHYKIKFELDSLKKGKKDDFGEV